MDRYRYYFFDLDNTLTSFDRASRLSFSSMMDAEGLPSDDRHYGIFYDINRICWEEVEQGRRRQQDIIHERWSLYYDRITAVSPYVNANEVYFDHLVEHTYIEPHALDVLDHIKARGSSMSIITNGLSQVQRRRLGRLGIVDYFDHVVISDEIGYAKPDGRFFDHAMQLTEHPNVDHILVIGDSLSSDIAGASAAGIDSCWYNPHHTTHYGRHNPTFEIDSLDGLLDLNNKTFTPSDDT